MQVKDQIREAMQDAGVTAYALAGDLGWHQQSLYRMLGGTHDMRLGSAEAIADALGFDLKLVPRKQK